MAAYAIATGAGCHAARAAAELAAAGAPALLSIGLAGGLAVELAAGAAVLASEVIASDGERFACDPAWRRSLGAALGGRACEAPLAGADRPVAEPAAKRALAVQSGAVVVDTESHHVARVAVESGLRFAALRIVIDGVDDRVPQTALSAYGADGRVRFRALVSGLVARPLDLPALLRLGRRSRLALARLSGVGRLGVRLGPPL